MKDGVFSVSLGSLVPLPSEALANSELWLAVSVRGPGESEFNALAPRQKVSTTSSSPGAPAAGLTCTHNHLGEAWTATGSTRPLTLNSVSAFGLEAWSKNSIGLVGISAPGLIVMPSGTHGVYGGGVTSGVTGTGDRGVQGFGGSIGVYGESTDNYGVYGHSENGTGVEGESNKSDGVYGVSRIATRFGGNFWNAAGGVALYASGTGGGADRATLRIDNSQAAGGMAGYLTNNSNYATVNMTNNGSGEVLYLQSNGGDYLRGINGAFQDRFRLDYNGVGRSLGGWVTGLADFAEMLPAEAGLEPGDVLVIGSSGLLTRSSKAFQSSVVGVYSTQPGFVGGMPMEGQADGTVPVAMLGVIPVKASAENGPIQPGDLLTSSATPGYAMKAGPNPPTGSIIGKALGVLTTGQGVIQMVVMLQ